MKKLLLILSISLLTSCASNIETEVNENTVVEGSRAKGTDFKPGELKALERKEGETVTEMLMRNQGIEKKSGESVIDMIMRAQGIGHYPKIGSFSSCLELITLLEEGNIKIISVEPDEVVVPMKGDAVFKYEFEKKDCPTL